jgi:hypothetical protein
MTPNPTQPASAHNPVPPDGCTCGALWTVRGKHGKKDCPYAQTAEDELDRLYNPSICDLELDEYQGNERLVVYLDDVKALVTRLCEQAVLEGKTKLPSRVVSATGYKSQGHIETSVPDADFYQLIAINKKGDERWRSLLHDKNCLPITIKAQLARKGTQ